MGGSAVHKDHNFNLNVFFVFVLFHKYNQCLVNLFGREYHLHCKVQAGA